MTNLYPGLSEEEGKKSMNILLPSKKKNISVHLISYTLQFPKALTYMYILY